MDWRMVCRNFQKNHQRRYKYLPKITYLNIHNGVWMDFRKTKITATWTGKGNFWTANILFLSQKCSISIEVYIIYSIFENNMRILRSNNFQITECTIVEFLFIKNMEISYILSSLLYNFSRRRKLTSKIHHRLCILRFKKSDKIIHKKIFDFFVFFEIFYCENFSGPSATVECFSQLLKNLKEKRKSDLQKSPTSLLWFRFKKEKDGKKDFFLACFSRFFIA